MKVGAPFNPYRVFQGSFAPYWLLEHRGISAGAKLCYIRLLGFAGKDARCYPSLETLGASLGVSDRQARDYVKNSSGKD
ncbi:MAG TPA: helix-turn-helix domain-containing protein [Bryobacteraceae bacterium]